MSPVYAPDRDPRARLGIALAVVAVHLLIGFALVRALAPGLVERGVSAALTAIAIRPAAPPPAHPPPPAAPRAAGARGGAGRHAVAKAIAAPTPRIALAPVPAPRAASTGSAVRSGAAANGAATGAGGPGSGPGAGAAGDGSGGGRASRFVQIAGAIDSARDYPADSRDSRLGHAVLIVFTVGADGRVHDCRVRESSGDPRADAITCELAEARFRFRPATDDAGNPVAATYGWRQRFWAPDR